MAALQVTGIMLPLLKFYFQEEVRQAAVQCIPDLLRSAYLAAQKGMPGADANYVQPHGRLHLGSPLSRGHRQGADPLPT